MAERSDLVRLREELRRDLAAAAGLLADAAEHRETLTGADPDRVVLGYLAVTLHRLYTALETSFERIARTLEGSLPKGADAHQALLHDMTLALPGIRPAVLRESTADGLRPLLRFRHFVRHSYAVAWDGERLAEVLRIAEEVWPETHEDMRAFAAFLDGLIDSLT
jgi:hypothetical protein